MHGTPKLPQLDLSIPSAKVDNKFLEADNKLMDYQNLTFKDAVAAFIIWGHKFSDMITKCVWIGFPFCTIYHSPPEHATRLSVKVKGTTGSYQESTTPSNQ